MQGNSNCLRFSKYLFHIQTQFLFSPEFSWFPFIDNNSIFVNVISWKSGSILTTVILIQIKNRSYRKSIEFQLCIIVITSFYNYRKNEKSYRRRYSPPPIYEDNRQQLYGHRSDHKYRENNHNRGKSYYYDSYGYKHYYSDESRNYNNPEKSRQRYYEAKKEEERRQKAADLEKKRRKEYLKNICCLFPCCCCCYCRCQKFPKEEEMSDMSDTDVSKQTFLFALSLRIMF